MLASSIIILLVIIIIFAYASYYLIQQKRLSERNKDFFNHMAHEFKTPLTNIGLAAKMLNKKSKNQLLDIIKNENAHLKGQVERVLSMASLESGNYDIRKECIDLNQLFTEIIEKMHIQLQDKGASIHIRGDKNIEVIADRFHLSNAIRNLIDNALKYNDRTPKIDVSLLSIGEKVRIQIQDNGIGIGTREKELVFEKFYRIKKGDLYANKGFGLGLSYVKKIMELHKGAINIFSDLTEGTRFDLTLPKATA